MVEEKEDPENAPRLQIVELLLGMRPVVGTWEQFQRRRGSKAKRDHKGET